ncbi:MAG: diacylglycerol kinase family lipid kinase [Prevotella sp.]|nr:diacylglycerol kinase family lipid kinase [Prevotella sp.]
MKSIVFIMNPISGTQSKAGIPELIEQTLDHEKFKYELRMTEYAGHASEIASEAKERGVDIVVAIGGDGTVNEVARSIVHSPTALGIVPCGSGNGLARHLMLPMNLKKAIEIINREEIHELDYGIINGHAFFCTCGMGFDAFVSQKFAEAGKRGPIAYVENVLREGLKYQPETYELQDEQGSTRAKAFLISCANASQYGNNAYIAPQASMSDGLLDVIIMEPFDVIEAPQISIDMFNKTLDKNSKIKTFKCQRLHVHRKQAGVIHYDGDPVMSDADVDIELKPKGIRVVVNPDADKSHRRPNAIQSAASELFNEINIVRDDITKQRRHVLALSKVLQRKLNL